MMVKVAAGDVYVTDADEHITTVLGSCISVCLRSTVTGRGGANHFMLPGHSQSDPHNLRYGITAIGHLVDRVLDGGGSTADLEAKVFGGASVIKASTDIGAMNIGCAYEELGKRRIAIASSDVGLGLPRKIVYDPKTGVVQLMRLRSAYHGLVIERERQHLDRILDKQGSGHGDR